METSRAPQAAVHLSRVTKLFGGTRALDDVSISFEEGMVHAVIGPNGAGKTTLQAVVSGQYRADDGCVRLFDEDITKASPTHRRRLGLARAFQIARVFPDITVAENVAIARYAAAGRSLSFRRIAVIEAWGPMEPGDIVWEILGIAGLHESPDKLAASLSQGQRKLLEVGLAVLGHPKVLLLDEPTAGMTAYESARTIDVLLQLLMPFGMTMILTEHDMEVVFRCAQRLVVMAEGGIVYEGDPSQARDDPEVLDAYLGSR